MLKQFLHTTIANLFHSILITATTCINNRLNWTIFSLSLCFLPTCSLKGTADGVGEVEWKGCDDKRLWNCNWKAFFSNWFYRQIFFLAIPFFHNFSTWHQLHLTPFNTFSSCCFPFFIDAISNIHKFTADYLQRVELLLLESESFSLVLCVCTTFISLWIAVRLVDVFLLCWNPILFFFLLDNVEE